MKAVLGRRGRIEALAAGSAPPFPGHLRKGSAISE